MTALKTHPELAKCLRPQTDREREKLAASIARDGVRDPIVVWDGYILDGHNRIEVARKLGKDYQTVSMDFADIYEAKQWMRDNQRARRNLEAIELVRLLQSEADDLAAKAKANMSKGGQGFANLQNPVHTSKELAPHVGISARQYDSLAKVVKDGSEDLQIAVREKQIGAEAAARIARNVGSVKPKEIAPPKPPAKDTLFAKQEAERKQAEYAAKVEAEKKRAELAAERQRIELDVLKRAKEIKKAKAEANKKARLERERQEAMQAAEVHDIKPRVIKGDCMDVLPTIGGIDLLIADPPYFTDGNFTAQVSRCLQSVKPSGQAFVFLGADPAELAAYLAIDSGDLVATQVLTWNYNNTGQRQPNESFTSNSQLAIYYRGPNAPYINKPADGKHQYACQTINAPDGRIGDRYHEWQKPLELIERLVLCASKKGDTVFDPFVGTGTTAIVAARHGRHGVGCDIDERAIRICEKRGAVRV